MKTHFPAFCTSLVGSMPRSKELLVLKEKMKKDSSLKDAYEAKVKEEAKDVVNMQLKAGIDVPVSGELNRDNFVSYVAEKVDGVQLMNMEEILSITTNSDSFNESLQQMDASDNSMSNPICVGKIDTEARLNEDECEMMKHLTTKPFKMTIPSPYLLTRSMWLKEVSKHAYANRKELGADVVKLLLNEVRHLVEEGVKVIQIDEPIISEVLFTKENSDNSFY